MPTMYPYNYQHTQNVYMSAPHEEFARNYPVAPGNSIAFRDETAPFIYTKTMGYSQFDRPIFEKWQRVNETTQGSHLDTSIEETTKSSYNDLKAEIESIRELYGDLESKIEALSKTRRVKKEPEDEQ